MTIGEFVSRVLAIRDVGPAQRFFDELVANLRAMPDVPADPEDTARQNIGWCFGEGMDFGTRAMWRTVCGAYHPVLGAMDREFTIQELLNAGMRIAEEGSSVLPAIRKSFTPVLPTVWERLGKDDDVP